MFNFLWKRILLFLSNMFILTLILFWMHIRLTGTDINRFLKEYILYTKSMLTGNFGVSAVSGLQIKEELLNYLPSTLELMVLAILLSFTIGIATGITSGLNHHTFIDKITTSFARLGVSIPVFWFGQMLIVIFAVYYKIFPTYGSIGIFTDVQKITNYTFIDAFISQDPTIIKDMLMHLCLPVLTLSIVPTAEFTALARRAAYEVDQTEFVQMAECHGLNRLSIAAHHIFKNIVPLIAPHFSIIICNLVSACILVEVVFEWPGIGLWLAQSVTNSDTAVIETSAFCIASGLMLFNLIIDIFIWLMFPTERRLNISI